MGSVPVPPLAVSKLQGSKRTVRCEPMRGRRVGRPARPAPATFRIQWDCGWCVWATQCCCNSRWWLLRAWCKIERRRREEDEKRRNVRASARCTSDSAPSDPICTRNTYLDRSSWWACPVACTRQNWSLSSVTMICDCCAYGPHNSPDCLINSSLVLGSRQTGSQVITDEFTRLNISEICPFLPSETVSVSDI